MKHLAGPALLAISIVCSRPVAAEPPHDVTGSIHIGDRDRTYRVHLPRLGKAPVPLVIALHGGSWQGPKMELVSELDATSNRHGFIVVYPDSVTADKQRDWADGRGTDAASQAGVDDVAFISALIDQLGKDYKLDPARIFATGISNGGFMSYKLACDLADRIAAIASVAATMPVPEAPSCKPARPLAVLDIHGTADPLVPYDGGELHTGGGGAVMSVTDTMKLWASIDGCDAKPVTSDVPDRAPRDGMRTHRDVYRHCKPGADLVLYTVDGGGHTWPGGGYMDPKYVGPTTKDFDASEAIWEFFEHHPMAPASAH